jgi:hypothetical protein
MISISHWLKLGGKLLIDCGMMTFSLVGDGGSGWVKGTLLAASHK